MTLDEAIEHYERNVMQLDGTVWQDIADDSRQLADWLTDLRMRRESEPKKKVVARITLDGERMEQIKQELEDEFLEMTKTLNAENDKLRELAGALLTSHEKMCTQRGHCFGCTFFYEEVKACPYVKISRTLRELRIEVNE